MYVVFQLAAVDRPVDELTAAENVIRTWKGVSEEGLDDILAEVPDAVLLIRTLH